LQVRGNMLRHPNRLASLAAAELLLAALA